VKVSTFITVGTVFVKRNMRFTGQAACLAAIKMHTLFYSDSLKRRII
jgi:hypothetical protein